MLSTADVAGMQATLVESFEHQLIVERAAAGAVDDYNHPARTWATLATTTGSVLVKRAEEVAQENEAGAVVATHTIIMLPRDIAEGDRIRHVRATCPLVDSRDLPDLTFALSGIRDSAGTGLNYAIDARVVTA